MKITDKELGECEMTIHHDRLSCVDSYFAYGYSDTLDRELTDDECSRLTDDFKAEIEDEGFNGGHSRNHN